MTRAKLTGDNDLRVAREASTMRVSNRGNTMRNLILALLLAAPLAGAAAPMTNEDVIKMAKGGLAEATILQAFRDANLEIIRLVNGPADFDGVIVDRRGDVECQVWLAGAVSRAGCRVRHRRGGGMVGVAEQTEAG